MSTATRFPYGMDCSAGGMAGAKPPMFDAMCVGTGDFISMLSAYKAAGARAIVSFVGSPSNYRYSDLSFSMDSWKAQMDKAFAKGSPAQVAAFVADGTLIGNWMMDDSKAGSTVFGGKPPTMDQHDEMAQYSKSTWSTVPCFVRVDNIYLATHKSSWTYLDAGWGQWHTRVGDPTTWFINNVNQGRAKGLGFMSGFNLLDGGSGATAPWNVQRSGTVNYTMSPMEVDAITAALSQATYAIGVFGWSTQAAFDTINWYTRTDIQAALQRMADAMQGRAAGPTNWRTSGQTSGSTVTVGGSWAVLGIGDPLRKNDTLNLTVPAPTISQEGSLQLLLCHSRDSGRSPQLPSGWSETARISGNSAQGGELVLFHKLGVATESDTVMQATGAGGLGICSLSRRFSFSHNTSIAGNLVAVVGSVKSWTSQTGMGPIPGLTSTASDALVIICAARCNDFGGGSVDENVMSATTGPESWSRLFATGSASGNDNGFFVDWAGTSGAVSVTTKSWSQTSGNESGAGCGFMVAFAPNAIVAGTPPQIDTPLEDTVVSINSTLSFTLSSSGSTPITYSKISGPSNITLGASTGAFQFTPTSVGTFTIVLRATNSFGSDTEGFNVTSVSGTPSSNNPPVITHPGDKTVAAHDLLSFIIVASDPDGDPITYSLAAGAPVGTYLDSQTGQFVWVPSGAQGPGVYPIVAVVSDQQSESHSTFTVTVTDTPWTRDRGRGAAFNTINPVTNQFRRI